MILDWDQLESIHVSLSSHMKLWDAICQLHGTTLVGCSMAVPFKHPCTMVQSPTNINGSNNDTSL